MNDTTAMEENNPVRRLAIIQDTWTEGFGKPRGLLSLNGHTFLAEISCRLGMVPALDRHMLVTSTLPADDGLAALAGELGIECFRGDPKDVLGRIMAPLTRYRPETVAKIHGSSPLVDPANLGRMIAEHEASGSDLTTCDSHDCILHGLGAEVISANVLEELAGLDLSPFCRELHTQYLKQNPERFRIRRCPSPLARPQYSLTVADRRDLILVNEIVKRLGKAADEASIVALLDANPHLAEINAAPPRGAEIGVEKVLLFPEKVAAIGRVARSGGLDASYPVSVELSLTDACQLRCVWCSDFNLRQRDNATMSLEKVTELLRDLKQGGTRGVTIEGGGEPTLHPDFERIVEAARSLGLAVGLISNGVRPLDQEVLAQLEWIRVSLDACNPAEFQKLKGRDCFHQVIENIGRMTQAGPVVGAGYVLTNENHEHLEDLVHLLQKLGADYLHIRPVVDHPELTFHGDVSYLANYVYHFPVLTAALAENSHAGNCGLPCTAHSLTTVISSSGDVYICGRLNILDWLEPIGNVNREPFAAIWSGAERERQARRLLDPAFCRRWCPQCRISKFNELFHKQAQLRTRNFI
jgi:spore coat polysaccharide biosynthesis protein SpsF (cytidylyltransferase family)/MoaA/NifB/PqqE/SkfB family radical SAM enzyme